MNYYDLIKTGKLPAAFGKALSMAAEFRLVADYQAEGVSAGDVQCAVEQTAIFVEAKPRMFRIPQMTTKILEARNWMFHIYNAKYALAEYERLSHFRPEQEKFY